MIEIVVADDQILFRDALVKLINSQSDMHVAADICEAKDALPLCQQISPDLVLLDVLTDPAPQQVSAVKGPTGISIAAQIRKEFPEIKVVIMTGLYEISLLNAAQKAGAHGFIYKNIHDDQFLAAIRNTVQGYNTFPEKIPAGLPFSCNFTDREMTVLRLFCKGKTRHEVANEIGISEALVKAVVTGLLNKTGFDSILRLAIYLTSNGYILPNIAE